MSQVDDSAPGTAANQGRRTHCMNGELAGMLVSKLERRGLEAQLVTYPGDASETEDVEQIVITNPAARERGEVRVGDDGSVTWEYFGSLDDTGIRNIVDEATNALRATGMRLVREPGS